MINEDTLKSILSEAWAQQSDSAHDIAHVERVAHMARTLAEAEGGALSIIIPAAWLHDIVNLPKNHPDRARASTMAADKACAILAGHDVQNLEAIHHAIAAHSFSACIAPTTLEAQILQDADRLDALGAIGIARCFAVSGALGRSLFAPDDPLAKNRVPDDSAYGLDHFQVKLYKIAETLHTQTARNMAAQRIAFMKEFEQQIAQECAH